MKCRRTNRITILELLRRAGWIDRLPAVERIALSVSEVARSRGRQTLLAAGARPNAAWIAFAPGAAYGSAKCWLPDRYAALADRMIDAADADVILFGAPQENEMASRIMGAMRNRAIDLVGKTSIADLPGLLAVCRQFVGNDSGAMHVAGAVGLPVVGIFGPTDPEGTSPVTPQFRLVREPVSCSPCFLRHCPIDHRCMTRISVDRVFDAAQSCSNVVRDSAHEAQRSENIAEEKSEAEFGSKSESRDALRPAVFLDRDGTICEEMGYINHISRVHVFPFAAAAIRRLNEASVPVIVVTNQSGISRGIFPEWLVAQVHELITRELAEGGAKVDAYYYCSHVRQDNCDCRKPLTGPARSRRTRARATAGSFLRSGRSLWRRGTGASRRRKGRIGLDRLWAGRARATAAGVAAAARCGRRRPGAGG